MIHGRHVISLCMSRLHDIENARFITELNRRLCQLDCSLWIYNINTDLYWNETDYNAETAVFDLIDYARSDAVIIMDEKIKSRRITEEIIRKSRAHALPVILIDGSHPECSEVRCDYKRGFEQIVRHVLETHHARRPHFLGGAPGNPFSDEREQVFRQALEESGIPVSDESISYGYFWAKPARDAAEALLRRPALPDAILCANDIMAINVCDVLTAHGVQVGKDIIVTGFDGMDEIHFSTPTVTSVQCGCSGFSETVCQAVQQVLEDPAHTKAYLVEPALLLGGSCGCQPESQGLGHSHSFNDRFYRYQDDTRSLSEMCERMQSFASIEESSYTLFGDVLTDVCCLINERCTDYAVDYFRKEQEIGFDDRMLLFLDTDQIPFRQYMMERAEVIPHLEEVMAQGFPLIFNAMDFMNVPIGYLCFHFREYEITNYCKIPQIVSSLSIGLGGFINRQYQSFLIREIERMYRNDSLTGLCNRLSFSKDFETLKETHGKEGMPLTVILSDLDRLKYINDHFGHAAGDNAIAQVAAALRQACPPEALSVRFGGDEMVAVIPGECDSAAVEQAIYRYLEAYNAKAALPYPVETSIGISQTVLREDTDFETLVRQADAAMYTVKQAHRAAREG